ncbi:LuxR C-terminal-related transcriptional regulator [Taibaiella koreensis]|uniref:LuxR C-terminal-related transcriptional regulator n=1 Tax=Taibaiella koreensis TaxID=1268548 RepID=UPI000E59B5F8|nr:LuxR C-terminal-related transcriptional regulator [Taibaiella koreensis]
MEKEEMDALHLQYRLMRRQQQWTAGSRDNSRLDHHLGYLAYLSEVGNYCILIFDIQLGAYVYASANFRDITGLDPHSRTTGSGQLYGLVHADDYPALMRLCVDTLKFLNGIKEQYRKDYKLLSEYRLATSTAGYVLVTERWQLLELDSRGNPWLALSILDLLPGRAGASGVKGWVVNSRSGEVVPHLSAAPEAQLTRREHAILKLMHNGCLCKEIAAHLGISIHTVHTHRQRILAKLGAGNAIEAINAGRDRGLLG